MTTFANSKFSKVIDKYLETGKVTVDFDAPTLVTTLNGEGFTPVESQQLVKDFGNHPVFKTIMEIVNSSPVASEARSHVNSVKSLQDALAGYGNVWEDEDIDFQEDIDDLLDEDGDGEWSQVSMEDLLDEIGTVMQAEETMKTLGDGEELAISIPGIGEAVIGKVCTTNDDGQSEEGDKVEPSPKELLTDLISKLVEDASGISELDDSDFYRAKGELDKLPSEIKKTIKMTALSTLGTVLIDNAKEVGFDNEELITVNEIIIKMLGEADRISGDNLPEPSDFIVALKNTLEQYL